MLIDLKIQRALRLFDGPGRDTMGIDHRRAHISVPQERLDRADAVICLQQVRRERMAEGMWGDALREFRLSNGILQNVVGDGLHALLLKLAIPILHINPDNITYHLMEY